MTRPTEAPGAQATPPSFLLSIDDAGRFLVVARTPLVLGHLRGGRADLPFLADLADAHARLERRDSFRDGAVWWAAPLGGEAVERNDEPVAEAVALHSGDRLRLGNLRIDFRMPDPASQTALLELKDGVECCGAQRVLLLAAGEAGRVRVGSAKNGHVKVPRLERDVVLVASADRVVACSADGETLLEVPLPVRELAHAALGPAAEGRPPLTLAIGPVEAMTGSGGAGGGKRDA